MDRTRNCSGCGEEEETGTANHCSSDLSNSQSKNQTESQPKKKRRLSRAEWLGIIALALVNLAVCGFPPASPTEWLPWFLGWIYKRKLSPTPLYCWGMSLAFLYLLLATREIRNRTQQAFHGFFTGAMVVGGVSILEFDPESSARKAGMQKGDVIIEYASEKDVTIEKLSAVMAKGGAGADQVRVVFVRDRQQYSQTLPSGPLGISAMDTKVNVLLKSE